MIIRYGIRDYTNVRNLPIGTANLLAGEGASVGNSCESYMSSETILAWGAIKKRHEIQRKFCIARHQFAFFWKIKCCGHS